MAWTEQGRRRGFATRRLNFKNSGRTCHVPECATAACSRGLCEQHYRRLLKHGSVSPSVERPIAKQRYRQRKFPGHPLANPTTGRAYVHRVVLYNASRGGRMPCFWCGRPLTWEWSFSPDALVVDHLDHDRHNNLETNLVPACNSCNARRSRRLRSPLSSVYQDGTDEKVGT